MALQLIAGELHADIYTMTAACRRELMLALIEILRQNGMELSVNTSVDLELTDDGAQTLQRAIDLIASGGIRQ